MHLHRRSRLGNGHPLFGHFSTPLLDKRFGISTAADESIRLMPMSGIRRAKV
jgi:hypothetical protein